MSEVFKGDWKAWADIVVRIWRQKMVKYGIGRYRASRTVNHEPLFSSFEKFVYAAAGGDQARIEFLFKEYGIFVDMGVGRDTPRTNQGSVKTKRKRKEWYSKVWYSEVMKLREYMAKQIGRAAANQILFGLQGSINGSLASGHDTKYASYRERDLARNALNYRKRNGLTDIT